MPFIFLVSLIVGVLGGANLFLSQNHTVPSPTSVPTIVQEAPTSIPTHAEQVYAPPPTVDPDPVIDCNTKSKGAIKLKRSVCTASVDCNVDGKYFLANNQDQCNGWVKEYYALIQLNQTIPQLKTSGSTLNTAYLSKLQADYQKYTNDLNNIGNNPIPQPAQHVPPQGDNCFTTWDQYFAAHPGYVGNVAGVGNPPCN